jgi:hypothetical protein
LKKSALISTAEKHAPEIEIVTLGRVFRAQISSSSVQKWRFSGQYPGILSGAIFSNTIDPKLPVSIGRNRPCAAHSAPRKA